MTRRHARPRTAPRLGTADFSVTELRHRVTSDELSPSQLDLDLLEQLRRSPGGLAGRPPVDDDAPVVIEADTDLSALIRDLQPLCDLGYVCDFTLRDGLRVSAMLVGVSLTSTIVDHWDSVRYRPVGDPFVLDIAAVQRVVVP